MVLNADYDLLWHHNVVMSVDRIFISGRLQSKFKHYSTVGVEMEWRKELPEHMLSYYNIRAGSSGQGFLSVIIIKQQDSKPKSDVFNGRSVAASAVCAHHSAVTLCNIHGLYHALWDHALVLWYK